MPEDTFTSFILDQLQALPDLRAKRMFGGCGLYSGDRFFGIVMDGRLYFKVNDANRLDYTSRGMSPFTYEKARQTTTLKYFETPPDVLDNKAELCRWARKAIQAAVKG